MMTVVLFTADLACSSKVAGAAARTGRRLETAMSAAALLDKAAGAKLVIIDLTAPEAEPGALLPRLRALSPPPTVVVAFGPHVHEADLAAARTAGCDLVLTRGQFHAQVDELLMKYLVGDPGAP
jgi:CheY-like chemotaxis protein